MYLSYNMSGIQIHFVYSPYHEMISSLHVLCKPEHHKTRYGWANKKIESMTQSLLGEMELFSYLSDSYMGFYELINDESLWEISLSEILYYIETLDYSIFIKQITSEKEMTPELKKVIDEEPALQKRCVDFLKTYYYEYFVGDISFAEPLLIRKLKKEYEYCKEVGPYNYIHGLHPRIEVTEEKINFHKYKLFEIYKSNLKQVIINVDSYIMPHLLLGIEESQIRLTTPVYITSYDENHLPQDTLNIFKGLSDKTRLNIIKYLYDSPMSTQSLAIKLNLTEAGISKHLKILHKAGIVSKERDGNFINYHLNQRIIDSLVLYMYELIS